MLTTPEMMARLACKPGTYTALDGDLIVRCEAEAITVDAVTFAATGRWQYGGPRRTFFARRRIARLCEPLWGPREAQWLELVR